ncbi:hypothetical protein V3C99_001058 [Haemonchus contortus]
MRLILLILFFAATLNDYSNATTRKEELIDKTEIEIIDRIRDKGDEALRTFHLTPEAMEKLEEVKQLPAMELDHLNPQGDYIDEINKRDKIDEKRFQGDIYLTKEQGKIIISELEEELESINRRKRQAFRDKDGVRLWKNHTVLYFFDENLSETAERAFLRGAEMWTKDTCIKFIEGVNETAQENLLVYAGKGCWSNLGKVGKWQYISLAAGCETTSIASHEIGHILGFYHTMSRHDRDKYIIVDLENIEKEFRSEFVWRTEDENDNFDLDYDYGSIMHYRASDGAINRTRPTLIPYDKYYRQTLGSPFVSFIDVLMLNKLYGCNKLCEHKQMKNGRNEKTRNEECQNGGYLHPLNCSKCVCPDGYAGDRCNERPRGSPVECGDTFNALKEWKNFTDRLGDGAVDHYKENYTKCYYWIESPENTEIEVEIVNFSRHHAFEGCPNAGVEIKTNMNQQLTGYRFCSVGKAGIKLRSYTNRVPIITWNRFNVSSTTLRYRHVSKDEPRPTTVRPQTRRVPRPLSEQEQNKCEDKPGCADEIAKGFCYLVPYEHKMAYCPRGCDLCGPGRF